MLKQTLTHVWEDVIPITQTLKNIFICLFQIFEHIHVTSVINLEQIQCKKSTILVINNSIYNT